jgi:hypothetical protein
VASNLDASLSDNPSDLLEPSEAAIETHLAPATLAKMRCWGGGPPYLKLGRKVLYERSAIAAWLAQRRVKNSSDAARVPCRLTEEAR